MSEALRVSVIIPAFNAANYLPEAIHSALNQTIEPFEVVVVDDGSDDETPAVAASFGQAIQYDRQPHKGLPATLNRGVQLARGELLAFLDHDDVWVPDKLQKQMAVLRTQPEIDMVFGYCRYFMSPDLDEATARRLHVPDKPQPAYLKSAMLIRRSSFFRVGLFDTALRMGDFIDWYSKAEDAGLSAHVLQDVLFNRRVHGRNMSLLERSFQKDYVRIAKAALDRRRSAAHFHANSDPKHEPSL
jgi:glycosyltransferase involved in cell wall biosynthesis